MKTGWKKRNVAIMACCCVCEMVERNRPAPSVVSRNSAAQNSSSTKAPAKRNVEDQQRRRRSPAPRPSKPTSANGSVLPSISSIGRIGVTINCSIVPISFSRTMASAVSISVTIMMMFTTTPGTK